MVSLGIDIVHIPSFAEQLRRPGSRFTDVFHPTELRQAGRLTGGMRTFFSIPLIYFGKTKAADS